ncbi:MAG TPA: hypothetical protein VGV38_12870 [Pyrinomonadaceae bacterium]|nr:hypothetical protein [Pyrinomonadaceae bacterium]
MGWEQRGRRSYYYRKERDGKRVRSVYVGGGELASFVGLMTEGRRAEGRKRREAERRARASIAETDAALDALAGMVESITSAALLASGYHTHKRQWRLIRGGKK